MPSSTRPAKLEPAIASKLSLVAAAFHREMPADLSSSVLPLAGYRMLDPLVECPEPAKRVAADALAFVGRLGLVSKLSTQDLGAGVAELVDASAFHRHLTELIAGKATRDARAPIVQTGVERSIRRIIAGLGLRGAWPEFRPTAGTATVLLAFGPGEVASAIPAPGDFAPIGDLHQFAIIGAGFGPAINSSRRRLNSRTSKP